MNSTNPQRPLPARSLVNQWEPPNLTYPDGSYLKIVDGTVVHATGRFAQHYPQAIAREPLADGADEFYKFCKFSLTYPDTSTMAQPRQQTPFDLMALAAC